MIKATFLICGVRTAGAVTTTITLTGKLAAPVELSICSQTGGTQTEPITGSTHVTELPKGDHILQVTAPLDGSDPGKGASMSCDGDVTFVERPVAGLRAWKGSVASTEDDPKDPWPPPGAVVKINDADWFEAELARLRSTIVTPRSGPRRDRPARARRRPR